MMILRPPKGIPARSIAAILIAIYFLQTPALAQFAEQVGIDGAFAYWTMNELGPGAATNAGSNADEAASFPDNGQIEFGVTGLADANSFAVRFAGFDPDASDEASGAGYLDIANSSLSNAGGPYSQKTVELWFNADDVDTPVEQVLFEQGGSTRGMVMYIRDGSVFVGAHNSNTDGGGVASPWPDGNIGDGANDLAFVSTEIESNTTYHLALVFDGDDDGSDGLDGTITGYLNGVAFGSTDGIGLLYAHTDAIRVGGPAAQTHFDFEFSGATPFGNDFGANGDAPTDNAPYFFSGVIDDVALYDTALSADRMAAHYAALEYIPGDFNSDGAIDLQDFLVFSGHFNKSGLYSNGDMSFNGLVDLEDFSMFRRAYAAANAPAAATAVPEPSARLMSMFGMLVLPVLLRRRFR